MALKTDSKQKKGTGSQRRKDNHRGTWRECKRKSKPLSKRKEWSRGEWRALTIRERERAEKMVNAWVRGKADVSQVIISVSQLETSSYHSQDMLLSIPHNPLLCSPTQAFWQISNQGHSGVYTAFSPNYIIQTLAHWMHHTVSESKWPGRLPSCWKRRNRVWEMMSKVDLNKI